MLEMIAKQKPPENGRLGGVQCTFLFVLHTAQKPFTKTLIRRTSVEQPQLFLIWERIEKLLHFYIVFRRWKGEFIITRVIHSNHLLKFCGLFANTHELMGTDFSY